MVGIIINETENIDRAIRRFKKKYERSGILKEVNKRAYFTKPSVQKRLKKIKAVRRLQRTLMDEM
jgi:small subunit ribosomal protein S21